MADIKEKIVPSQQEGGKKDIIHQVTATDQDDARKLFFIARNRLLEVNQWHNLAGMASAKFILTDSNGNEIDRTAEKGDYFKIDLPGPGSVEGEGFDWVHVEDLKEVTGDAVQSIGFRVRPTANPLNKSDHIAHFYDDTATSSFIVTKEGLKVIATIIDRNLKPNDDNKLLSDRLRHTVVGRAAINNFSKIQWKNLAKGLVEIK